MIRFLDCKGTLGFSGRKSMQCIGIYAHKCFSWDVTVGFTEVDSCSICDHNGGRWGRKPDRNEVRTLSDEEAIFVWAAENKINKESIEKLIKDGFTSMDALRLVDQEDLHNPSYHVDNKNLFSLVFKITTRRKLRQRKRSHGK